jgi:hypothetical protein
MQVLTIRVYITYEHVNFIFNRNGCVYISEYHDAADLFWGYNPRYALASRSESDGHQSRSGRCEKEKFFHLPGIEYRYFGHLVSTLNSVPNELITK